MKQITKYKCDFCKRSYVSNPDVKSCVTCKHKDIKEFLDNEDCVGWCYKMNHEIFRKGYVIKHCVGWESEKQL